MKLQSKSFTTRWVHCISTKELPHLALFITTLGNMTRRNRQTLSFAWYYLLGQTLVVKGKCRKRQEIFLNRKKLIHCMICKGQIPPCTAPRCSSDRHGYFISKQTGWIAAQLAQQVKSSTGEWSCANFYQLKIWLCLCLTELPGAFAVVP